MPNNYPGLSESVSSAFEAVRRGEPVDLNVFNVRRVPFYHRLGLIVSGSTALTLSAFNVAPSKFVSNFYGPGGLPQDVAAWVRGFRMKIQTGTVLADGTMDTHTPTFQRAADNSAVNTTANIAKFMTENGLVNISFGDRPIVSNAYGIETFPAGHGIDGFGYATSTVAAFEQTGALVSNGSPIEQNMFALAPWAPLLPGKPVTWTVEYQSAPTGATNLDFTLKCVMDCLLISPVNN